MRFYLFAGWLSNLRDWVLKESLTAVYLRTYVTIVSLIFWMDAVVIYETISLDCVETWKFETFMLRYERLLVLEINFHAGRMLEK